MTKSIVFILTEGDHDSAFIYRILKANGLISDHKTAIKNYPSPLNELMKNGVYSIPIEELNMVVARSRFMPSYIMQKDDNIVCIYRVGGESKEKIRTDFIKSINKLNTPDPDAVQIVPGAKISVLFFFDADDKGVEKRIEQIKRELKSSFPESEAENIDRLINREVILVQDMYIGGFIFTELGKNEGMLEDVLVPLMRQGNDDIFEKAEYFLSIHEDSELFRGKVKYDSTGKIKKSVNEEKYTHKKSLVGTVGQLQMSGKSNTVCISDADYLNKGKVKADATCIDIFNFIDQVL
jgi:hypothetical protein